MAKPKSTYTNLLDEKFSDIKLEHTGPGAEIEIIASCDDIGKGTYGRIFKVKFNGAACVAREFHPDVSLKGKSNCEDQYLSNCRKCRDLRHPNIIQFFGVVCNTKPNNPPIQVMEKMHCSLTSYIERSSDIATSTKLSILHDVAAGLQYLHCRKPQPIVHCYLSSNNVFLTNTHVDQLQAKISDVGLAQMVRGHKSTSKSIIFMAPEMTGKSQSANNANPSANNANPSADVFSYGAVMLHTITQQWPELSVMSSICEKKKESTSNDLDNLMGSCLDKNSRNRPKVTNVLTTIKAIITNPAVSEAEQKLEQENELQKEHEPIEETNKTLMKENLAQVNAIPQKQDKRSNTRTADEKDKDENQEINSQQDQPKHQDNEPACHSNKDDHLEQENREDDDADQRKSHRDEDPPLNDEESKCVTEQQQNEEKISKENSNSDQLILKGTAEISTKKNLEQVNATSSKQDEPIVSNEQKEENKQESSRSNSQQDKRQKKKTCKNQAAHQDIQENGLACHINDQLEQDDRKDDATDQQLSSRDGQDDGKRNRASGSDTSKKKQKNKEQQSTSTGSHCKFDQLGPKVIGFHNEGNTCFFNAMLQCIHQTVNLHYAIAESKRIYKIDTSRGPLVIEVTKKSGQLTVDMRRLFYEISRQTGPISPHNLLQTIGRRNNRFGHGTQEDSHEVLRYLLSVLREEEIECIKQKFLSGYDTKEELLTDKSVDGEIKLYVKECLSKLSKGVCDIDCIFGSYLISTTVCHECETPLQTTEFHFDFSLPMPEDKSHAKAQNYPEVPHSSKKRKGKGKGRKRGAQSKQLQPLQQITPTQAHAFSSEESISIPEIVKSQQKFNSHLQERKLSHCSYSDANDLKLETILEHCLLTFTSIDTLDEDNKFICQACSDGKPDIVLCCVSKFHIGSYRVTKDNRRLSFPFILDMSPFCTTECIETYGDTDKKILYGLYAAVEHNGSLHGGHYATYVRRRPLQNAKEDHSTMGHSMQNSDVKLKRKCNRRAAEEGEWYYTNDSHTSKCNPNAVMNCRPYLLFYEMLPKM